MNHSFWNDRLSKCKCYMQQLVRTHYFFWYLLWQRGIFFHSLITTSIPSLNDKSFWLLRIEVFYKQCDRSCQLCPIQHDRDQMDCSCVVNGRWGWTDTFIPNTDARHADYPCGMFRIPISFWSGVIIYDFDTARSKWKVWSDRNSCLGLDVHRNKNGQLSRYTCYGQMLLKIKAQHTSEIIVFCTYLY